MLRLVWTTLLYLLTLVVSFLAGGFVLFGLAAALGGREEVIGIFYLIVAPAAVVALLVFGLVHALVGTRRAARLVPIVVTALLAAAAAFLWLTSADPSPLNPQDSDPRTILMIVLPPAVVAAVQWLMLKGRMRA